jgi:hypothetical protein
MAYRQIFKDGQTQSVSGRQAKELTANEGWSYTDDSVKATLRAVKTVKPKKAKVEVEAEIKVDSPFNDGDPVNTDFGTINEEN